MGATELSFDSVLCLPRFSHYFVIPAQAGISTGFRCEVNCRINGESRVYPKLRRDSRLRGNDKGVRGWRGLTPSPACGGGSGWGNWWSKKAPTPALPRSFILCATK